MLEVESNDNNTGQVAMVVHVGVGIVDCWFVCGAAKNEFARRKKPWLQRFFEISAVGN